MQKSFVLSVLACGLTAALAGGCQVFLPAHSKSHDIEGESVEVHMLDHETMMAMYGDQYDAAFGGKKVVPPAVAAAATALIGFAVDFTKKQIEEEASLYEAQWGKKAAFDHFWSPDGKQQYYGFEVIRGTRKNPLRKLGEKQDTAAFHLVCGIAPSADGQMFQVAPLQLTINSVKAKVLSDQWLRTFYTVLWKPLLRTGHEVDVSADVEITAIWRDKNQTAHLEQLATFTVAVPAFDLNANNTLDAGDGLHSSPVGWFPGIPRSVYNNNDGKEIEGLGTFWVKATVTERDPSNAKKYLEQAADLVGKQKDTIVQIVTKENPPKP